MVAEVDLGDKIEVEYGEEGDKRPVNRNSYCFDLSFGYTE
ncbi:MAG: hypothetical protein BWX92_03033 [Deltaproteobacteria bacterium ADurb.Bin135]|nr:MAG: hypothetical protein BWX92_03033 [Deltaproteobacteria bacterium ADurb.Bin135]